MKTKKAVTGEITTTIEDDVVFMVDPRVDFVSLVKHGANRAPFKILKSDKGGSEMNKVLQAILIRHDTPDDAVQKALEGMEKSKVKKFDSYDSYIQVPLEQFEQGSMQVIKQEDGIFSVIGDLSEGDEKGKIVMDVKQAIDYATLDSLYSELYAMADIVSGAMRQENADTGFRADTILKAIDNFRAYAEVVLQNLGEQKAVKLENHPHLAHPLVKQEAEEEAGGGEGAGDEQEAEAEDAGEGEAAAAEPEGAENSEGAVTDEAIAKIAESIEKVTTMLEEFGKRITAIEEKSEANEKAVAKAEESIKEVKSTVKSSQTKADEEPAKDTDRDSKGTFNGVFFRTRRQAS